MSEFTENRAFTYDANLASIGATTKTSTYNGSIIDTGGGYTKGMAVFNVTACTYSTNQLYKLCVEGSSDSDFGTAANVVDLAKQEIGAGEVLRAGTAANDEGTGIYKFPWHNMLGATIYRYIRLSVVISGSSPSITLSAVFGSDD